MTPDRVDIVSEIMQFEGYEVITDSGKSMCDIAQNCEANVYIRKPFEICEVIDAV